MHLSVVNITPEMAARWLKRNGLNRKKSPSHVKRLAEKMAEGRWIVNGQTISFDIDGKLIDGQHRLEAIVMSGVTIEHAVAMDVADPKAFASYDGDALKRLADQVVQMMGAKNASNLVAAARVIYAYESAATMEEFSQLMGSGTRVRTDVITEYAIAMRHEHEAAVEMIGTFSKRTASPSLFLALVTIFNRIEPAATAEFCRKLRTGVFESEQDPCLLLRDRLLSESKLKGIKWKRTMAAITIKAFNYHVEGKPLASLRWRMEGSNPERFPSIQGDKE